MSTAFYDNEYMSYRHDARRGSLKLRNAILRSIGAPVVRERSKPVQLVPRKRGRPPSSPNKIVRHKPADIKLIQKITAHCCRVRLENLRGPRRNRRMTKARQLAMWVARDELGASYPTIGRAFDRDHTTVLYGCREIQKLVDAGDRTTINALNAIRGRLGE